MSLVEPLRLSRTPAPPPGLYPGVDFDTYASWDAANQTILTRFARTPAHVLYELQHEKTTPALELGWLTHLATFEPDRYAAEVITAPPISRRSKVGKAEWAAFEAAHPGKHIVQPEDNIKALTMARAVWNHPTARLYLESRGHSEVSIVWNDTAHGIICKARIDRYGYLYEWPVVGDLKTSRDAGLDVFQKSILNFGYDVQAAHYLAGLEALYPITAPDPFRLFVFIVVESAPPHCVALYQLDDDSLEEGARKRSIYLTKYRECVESGTWPGYDPGIQYARLPAWAFKHFHDF